MHYLIIDYLSLKYLESFLKNVEKVKREKRRVNIFSLSHTYIYSILVKFINFVIFMMSLQKGQFHNT